MEPGRRGLRWLTVVEEGALRPSLAVVEEGALPVRATGPDGG